MSRLVIRNEDELNEALDRAFDLAGSTNDTDDQRELAEIAEAVKVYEDSLAVMKGVSARGGKAG